jgi:hypothetical protein
VWEEIAKWFGGMTGATLLLAYLGRKLFAYVLDRDMEQFRQEAQKELEQVKANLRRIELRFSRLHEDQAKAIALVYGCLVKVQGTLVHYADPLSDVDDEGRRQRQLRADEAMAALYEAFAPRRLYFPKEIADDLESLMRELNHIKDTADNEFGVEGDLYEPGHTLTRFIERIPPIISRLDVEFRKLLGHEDEAD